MASFDFGEVEPCSRSSLRILSKTGGATPGVRVGACTPPRGEATGGACELYGLVQRQCWTQQVDCLCVALGETLPVSGGHFVFPRGLPALGLTSPSPRVGALPALPLHVGHWLSCLCCRSCPQLRISTLCQHAFLLQVPMCVCVYVCVGVKPPWSPHCWRWSCVDPSSS